jgi:hypothetical protein
LRQDRKSKTAFVEVLEGLGDIGRAMNVLESIQDDISQTASPAPSIPTLFIENPKTLRLIKANEDRTGEEDTSMRQHYALFKIQHAGGDEEQPAGKILIDKLMSQTMFYRAVCESSISYSVPKTHLPFSGM